MSDLNRTNPFSEMMTLRDAMNQLFAESFVSPRRVAGQEYKPLDLYETEQEYVARLAVPGLKPDDFEITLQENILSVRGQTSEEKKDENVRYHVQEQHFGSFERTIRFPTVVDADNVAAELANGILTIRVPKAEAARPRRINVQTR